MYLKTKTKPFSRLFRRDPNLMYKEIITKSINI